MKQTVKPVPEGYHTVTPYLIVNKGTQAIEFYKKVFKATVVMCMSKPDGRVGHAELMLGDSKIMLADEFPEMDVRGPEAYGGSPIALHLYVENVNELFSLAIAAGAQEIRPLHNQFYGDRSGSVKDPFGHTWHLATHIEDVSETELNKRIQEMMQQSQ